MRLFMLLLLYRETLLATEQMTFFACEKFKRLSSEKLVDQFRNKISPLLSTIQIIVKILTGLSENVALIYIQCKTLSINFNKFIYCISYSFLLCTMIQTTKRQQLWTQLLFRVFRHFSVLIIRLLNYWICRVIFEEVSFHSFFRRQMFLFQPLFWHWLYIQMLVDDLIQWVFLHSLWLYVKI